MIMVVGSSFLFAAIAQNTVRKKRLRIYGICTSHIKSYRIKRSKHSYIWNNGSIILSVAVTVWRYVNYQTDVEMRTVVNNSLCIFCNFAV